MEAHKKTHIKSVEAPKKNEHNTTELSVADEVFVPSFVSPYKDCLEETESSSIALNFSENEVDFNTATVVVSNNIADSDNIAEVMEQLNEHNEVDTVNKEEYQESSELEHNSMNRWKAYKANQRARKSINDVVNKLRSATNDENHVRKLFNDPSLGETLAYVSVETVNEGIVSNAFINCLKNKEKLPEFYKIVVENFDSQLDDNNFCAWLARKLEIRPSRFAARIRSWRDKNFQETRGKKSLSRNVKQIVYNEWKENSIYSVDRRNNRDKVRISKRMYLVKYSDLEKEELLEEERNKRGTMFYCHPRMVITCTVRELQNKLNVKHNLNVSYGTVFNAKPFFITFANEKEKVLCMCKLCLNARLLFNPLMDHSKSCKGEEFNSISDYFMNSCTCPRSENGYYQYICCQGRCSNCKNIELPLIPQLTSENTKTFYQFELTKTPYTCKKTGTEKISLKTERIEHKESVSEICKQFVAIKIPYLVHRFQVSNDEHQWKNILGTVREYGPIFHMDYSENLALSPKYEPQSAHFNKKQYSLHCIVGHCTDNNDDGQYKYYYHLSDDISHDYAFTGYVVEDVLKSAFSKEDNRIIRFKSDNCSVQYKSKKVFSFWKNLAIAHDKICIVYYGVPGHGKGTVDAMSGFGVKDPIRKAIIQHDLFFNSAKELYEYLIETKGSTKMNYHLVHISELEKRRTNNDQLVIKQSRDQHILVFKPDGSIQSKVNLCSCEQCIKGDLIYCKCEKGVLICNGDAESDEEEEDDNENGVVQTSNDKEVEENEMYGSNILDVITTGSVVALYSDENARELFYLCKILDVKTAEETVQDNYDHYIEKNTNYLICNYFERVKERRGMVQYQLLDGEVFVHPCQVAVPFVGMSDKHCLTVAEYQFIADCV